ncbi:hypothetical protein [Methylorubrum extorquens]
MPPLYVVVLQRDYPLFDVPASHKFETSRECQLHIKHAERLCKVFGAKGIEPDCYVAHAHEAESAFVCEVSLDGAHLLVAFPTVLNPKGELRCLAEDLVLAEVLGQSISFNAAEPAAVQAANVPLITYQPQ